MLFAAVVTFLSAGVLTPQFAAWAHRRNLLDVPNHRSSHVVATPRIGGAALVSSVLAGVAVLQVVGPGISREAALVLAGAVAIAGVGLLDDLWDLSALARLAVHAAVAAMVVMMVGPAPLRWLSADNWVASCLTVLWIVTLTNAYNFMDGIDGIAGAQALVGGMGWTAVALLARSPDIAALGLLLTGASSGFLLHNWHPAKVFMGDAGSGFFGFLFAALPLLAPPGRVSLLWCAVLLMWPFLFDTGFTLLRRASRSENLLSAHRTHMYQRLVLSGCSHRHVALMYAGLALLGAVAAVSVQASSSVQSLASVAAILVAAGALWWHVILREAAAKAPPSSRAAI
jgi:UDP-N-acetylmuramyl pentapeptide phosphotransferase/UDP-N-acetylglucosamine-1-phosphate transferase